MEPIIVPMQLEHNKDVVAVHIQAFRGFFLTFLGPGFLSELYRGILTDPSGMAFVALAGGGVIGFAAGAANPAGFYQRLLKKRWWRFGVAALPAVIKKPSASYRLFRALSLPKQVAAEKDRGTLMSLAVVPGQQGQGTGRALVHVFLEEAARRGVRKVDLLTDKVNNAPVNAFYLRQGFTLLRSYATPEGREINEYIIDLITGPSK